EEEAYHGRGGTRPPDWTGPRRHAHSPRASGLRLMDRAGCLLRQEPRVSGDSAAAALAGWTNVAARQEGICGEWLDGPCGGAAIAQIRPDLRQEALCLRLRELRSRLHRRRLRVPTWVTSRRFGSTNATSIPIQWGREGSARSASSERR